MLYKSPKNEDGQEYFVPIVVQSREFLIGYLASFEYILYALEFEDTIDLNLDSSRFNDIIDDGVHLASLSKKEIEEMILSNDTRMSAKEIKKKQKEHPDNKKGVLDQTYLELNCKCGGFYSFKNHTELPHEDFYCGICSKLLIQYTNKSDDEYEFDGDLDSIVKMETEIENDFIAAGEENAKNGQRPSSEDDDDDEEDEEE